ARLGVTLESVFQKPKLFGARDHVLELYLPQVILIVGNGRRTWPTIKGWIRKAGNMRKSRQPVAMAGRLVHLVSHQKTHAVCPHSKCVKMAMDQLIEPDIKLAVLEAEQKLDVVVFDAQGEPRDAHAPGPNARCGGVLEVHALGTVDLVLDQRRAQHGVGNR